MVKQHTHHKEGEPNTKARKVINMAIGSLSKIPTMVDEKAYCPSIIQQLDSVIGLLKSARTELLKGHLESCLVERLKTDKEGSIKELLKIYNMQ
jgi:DNA-binding FrmR family transcriptional regulator